MPPQCAHSLRRGLARKPGDAKLRTVVPAAVPQGGGSQKSENLRRVGSEWKVEGERHTIKVSPILHSYSALF